MFEPRPAQFKPTDTPVLSAVADAIAAIRFGELRLTVHDGQVVQLETTEKIRFAARPSS